jgi:hypothetical protein
MMSISTTEQDLRTGTKIITHMHPRFPRPFHLATSRTANILSTNAIRHKNRRIQPQTESCAMISNTEARGIGLDMYSPRRALPDSFFRFCWSIRAADV